MSIKFRLLALVSFFLALMVINAVTINVWIEGAKGDGTTLNIAGRQRMLSQKISKEVMFAVAGEDLSGALKKTQALFDSSLKALSNYE